MAQEQIIRQLSEEEKKLNTNNKWLRILEEEEGPNKNIDIRDIEIKKVLLNTRQRRGIHG